MAWLRSQGCRTLHTFSLAAMAASLSPPLKHIKSCKLLHSVWSCSVACQARSLQQYLQEIAVLSGLVEFAMQACPSSLTFRSSTACTLARLATTCSLQAKQVFSSPTHVQDRSHASA